MRVLRLWVVRLFGLVDDVIFVGALITLFVLSVYATKVPDVDKADIYALKTPFQVYTKDSKLMGEYGEERRIPVTFDEIPQALVDAVLAAEDDRFFEHFGVDYQGIIRAAVSNFRGGSLQGASTITMQVARNYFLSRDQTYERKIIEILLSFKLEKELTKKEIFELYVNKIFLGHRSYGFAAAAKTYYNKPLGELSLEQIAMLAGLPKAPSTNNPLSNPERAIERRNYVLNRMLTLEKIDQKQYEDAKAQPLSASKYETVIEYNAPYMAEMVRQYLVEQYGTEVYGMGLKIFTTLDRRLQTASDEALSYGLQQYERRRRHYSGPIDSITNFTSINSQSIQELLKPYTAHHTLIPAIVVSLEDGQLELIMKKQQESVFVENWQEFAWPNIANKSAANVFKVGDVIYIDRYNEKMRLAQLPSLSGALVSLDPNTGAINALSGGFDFNISKFNRVTQAYRQAGSTIKPFIYSKALDDGYSPISRVNSGPLVIKDPSLPGGLWRPHNYSGKFYGDTTLRNALKLSMNLVSIRLLQNIGINQEIDYLSRFDFDSENLPRGLSLALGSLGATPLQMTASYAVFANGGYKVTPYFIERIEDAEGNVLMLEDNQVCRFCERTVSKSQTGLEQQSKSQRGNNIDKKNLNDDVANAEQGQTPLAPIKKISALKVTKSKKPAISPANAFVITDMLREVVRSGTAYAAKNALNRSDIGGKTGTTNDYIDAWFMGFNPDVVTGVWVGFDQPKSMGRGETGTRAALPIWIEYMKHALEGREEKDPLKPDNVQAQWVNKQTGRVTTNSEGAYKEYFMVLSDKVKVPDDQTIERTQDKLEQMADELF